MTETTSTPGPKRPRRRSAAGQATTDDATKQPSPPRAPRRRSGTTPSEPSTARGTARRATPAGDQPEATRPRARRQAPKAAAAPAEGTAPAAKAAEATESAEAAPRTRRRRATATPTTPDAAATASEAPAAPRTRTRRAASNARPAETIPEAPPPAPAEAAAAAAAATPAQTTPAAPATPEPAPTPTPKPATEAREEAPPEAPAPAVAAAASADGEAVDGDAKASVVAAVRQAAEASAVPARTPMPGATLTVAVGRDGVTVGVVDGAGAAVGVHAQVPSGFPSTPEALVEDVRRVAEGSPPFERVSVGFPGTVREGRVVSPPSYVSGSKGKLRNAWIGFDLGGAMRVALGKPARVTGATVLTGASVIEGRGLELVVTLDEGVGAGVFLDGRPAPQLDLGGHEFRKGATYTEQLGDAGRRKAGRKKWNRRVQLALASLDRLLGYDRVYVGGPNTRYLIGDLGPKVRVLDHDDAAALGGGARLWEGGDDRSGAR